MAMISDAAREAAASLGQLVRTDVSITPWGRSEYVYLKCGLVVRVSDHLCAPRENQIDISRWASAAEAERQIAAAIARQRRFVKKSMSAHEKRLRVQMKIAIQLLDALQMAEEHPLTDAQRRRFERRSRNLIRDVYEAINTSRVQGKNTANVVAKKIAKAVFARDERVRRLCAAFVEAGSR